MPVPVTLSGVLFPPGKIAHTSFSEVADLWLDHVRASGVMGDEVYQPCLEMNPVSDQLKQKSCVANAGADGLELCMGLDQEIVQLSRDALYYWSRVLHGGQMEDEGTYVHTMLQQANTMGVLPESRWDYTVEHVEVAPPNDVIIAASNNRIKGYYQITHMGSRRGDSIEIAIRAGQVVIGSWTLAPDFGDTRPGQVVQPGIQVWGYHAMLIVGFKVLANGQRIFRVRNSWGPSWCDGGYCWVSEEFISSPVHFTDIWAITAQKKLVL